MPMTIVAVHADPSLAGDLANAQAGAAGRYDVIPSFAHAADLIAQIAARLADNNNDCLEKLEIVAHGNPNACDSILQATAAAFGASLKTLNLCDVCDVYLSACNTAINTAHMNSISQVVSANGPTVADDNVMLTVHGSVGYIRGLHVLASENTSGSRGKNGVYTSPYPDAPDALGGGVRIGSHDAVGQSSWRKFREGRRVL